MPVLVVDGPFSSIAVAAHRCAQTAVRVSSSLCPAGLSSVVEQHHLLRCRRL